MKPTPSFDSDSPRENGIASRFTIVGGELTDEAIEALARLLLHLVEVGEEGNDDGKPGLE